MMKAFYLLQGEIETHKIMGVIDVPMCPQVVIENSIQNSPYPNHYQNNDKQPHVTLWQVLRLWKSKEARDEVAMKAGIIYNKKSQR